MDARGSARACELPRASAARRRDRVTREPAAVDPPSLSGRNLDAHRRDRATAIASARHAGGYSDGIGARAFEVALDAEPLNAGGGGTFEGDPVEDDVRSFGLLRRGHPDARRARRRGQQQKADRRDEEKPRHLLMYAAARDRVTGCGKRSLQDFACGEDEGILAGSADDLHGSR